MERVLEVVGPRPGRERMLVPGSRGTLRRRDGGIKMERVLVVAGPRLGRKRVRVVMRQRDGVEK